MPVNNFVLTLLPKLCIKEALKALRVVNNFVLTLLPKLCIKEALKALRVVNNFVLTLLLLFSCPNTRDLIPWRRISF
ncbi:hypothetical protein EUA81_00950 [TM7 phylum sp. oral taxon 356]|nr:hypothetical protein EUA81_00950 [TM7 phylum sp. oral taxon 356]